MDILQAIVIGGSMVIGIAQLGTSESPEETKERTEEHAKQQVPNELPDGTTTENINNE